jgi:hypothetical protein
MFDEAPELVDDYTTMVNTVVGALIANPEPTRDYLLNLALNCFWADDVDKETMAVIGLGLSDVRVRDTIIWHMKTLDSEQLIKAMTLLIETGNIVYVNDEYDRHRVNHSLPAYTVAAIAAMLNDDKSNARDCINFVVDQGAPVYSLAALMHIALDADMPSDVLREEILCASYDSYRYGQ